MPHSLQIKPLLTLLATIILAVLVSGCGEITRSEYDNARSDYDSFVAEWQLPNGDTRVVHHGLDPRMDFAGNYTCATGIRVATFRNGVLIGRYFQKDQPAQFIALDMAKGMGK